MRPFPKRDANFLLEIFPTETVEEKITGLITTDLYVLLHCKQHNVTSQLAEYDNLSNVFR